MDTNNVRFSKRIIKASDRLLVDMSTLQYFTSQAMLCSLETIAITSAHFQRLITKASHMLLADKNTQQYCTGRVSPSSLVIVLVIVVKTHTHSPTQKTKESYRSLAECSIQQCYKRQARQSSLVTMVKTDAT